MTAFISSDNRLSDQIRVARVLCILAVIYVHVPPYAEGLPDRATSILGIIHIIRDVIGRSSVPLLSIVSGYLLARGLSAGKGHGAVLDTKVRSILVPLIAWNALFLGLGLAVGQGLSDRSILSIINSLVGLTSYPALHPLYFLRDVFACCLLSPLLVRAAATVPRISAAILLVNALADLDGLIVLNSAIPLFFFLGLIVSNRRSIVSTVDRLAFVIGLASFLTLLLIAIVPFVGRRWIETDQGQSLYAAMRLVARFAGAGLFWSLSGWIVNNRALASMVRAYEPVIFFLFCAHPIVIGVLWMILQAMGVTLGSASHALFFLAAPALVLIASVCAVAIMKRIAPGPLRILMGGRAPTPDQLGTMMLAPVAWFRSPRRTLMH